jgi:hypothetical protein
MQEPISIDRTRPGVALIATAAAAAAIGAVAIGAPAIRRLAVRKVVIDHAEFKSLTIDDLTVTRGARDVTVTDALTVPEQATMTGGEQ